MSAMWKVVLYLSLGFLGLEGLLHRKFEKNQNVWIYLAKEVVNTTHFCLAGGTSVQDVFTSCLIGMPTPLETLQSHIWLKNFDLSGFNLWNTAYEWGPITQKRKVSTFSIDLLTVTSPSNTSCAQFVNCTKVCENLTREEGTFNCSNKTNVSYGTGNVILPSGWFLLCGKTAYSYIPANATGGPCTLGRLTVWLPKMSKTSDRRHRRSSSQLDESCDSNINLLSKAEAVSLAVSIVGLPALVVGNHGQISKVVCALAKSLNTTSQALAALSTEMKELQGPHCRIGQP
ncbi:uncharacterized protein LOC132247730 [Alligator mississippiensis]|uniref:uncharacterized protein LOC132247730 n=1 Tax=Alligator mississippiensis TaxID=8496 RepID=UPI002877AA60|nr:uncharacterized protein LOC132247730 [Alligator mississippiensis]